MFEKKKLPGRPSLIIIFVITFVKALDSFIGNDSKLILFDEFNVECEVWTGDDDTDCDDVKNANDEAVDDIDFLSSAVEVDVFCHISNNEDDFCVLVVLSMSLLNICWFNNSLFNSVDKWDVNCLKFVNWVEEEPKIGWLVILSPKLFSIIVFGVLDDGDI